MGTARNPHLSHSAPRATARPEPPIRATLPGATGLRPLRKHLPMAGLLVRVGEYDAGPHVWGLRLEALDLAARSTSTSIAAELPVCETGSLNGEPRSARYRRWDAPILPPPPLSQGLLCG